MYVAVKIFVLALCIKNVYLETISAVVHHDTTDYLRYCSKYDIVLRPVDNDKDAVNVNVTMMIQRITSLTSEGLTIDAGLTQRWRDSKFCSNSKLPVQRLSLPKSRVWTPDVTSYERPFSEWQYEPNIVFYKNRDILYTPVTSLWTDKCSVNEETGITECSIRMGTWTYDKTELNLQSDGIQFYEYKEHPNFKILNTTAVRHDQHDECCEESFPYIKYTFSIRKI